MSIRNLIKKIGKLSYPSPMSKLKSLKTSNELFILASGSSINQIKNWDRVKEADSVGFNFFMLHNFVPTFYYFEPEEINKRNDFYIKNILTKQGYFEQVFIRKMKNSLPIVNTINKIGAKAINVKPLSFKIDSRKQLEEKVRKVLKDSFFNKNLIYHQGSASIDLLSLTAMRLGYKKIYFCGVDLNNSKYFYESEEYKDKDLQGLVPWTGHEGKLHGTEDKSKCTGGLVVTDVLKSYQQVFSEIGGEMYTCNPNSSLAKFMPVYEL